MNFPLEIPAPVRRLLPPGTGVLLGISGGVDSAFTLALLSALECDVQCVTFKNVCFSETADDAPATACCSLDAIEDARRQSHRFGAPHWVGNIEESFRTDIIEPFIAEYAAGRTPNPCLRCNSRLRFPELVRLAARQGCSFAATGHYARLAPVPDSPREVRLLQGVDPAKDQSYFLHRVERELWSRLVFPLGWYTKDQVRGAARELGLEVADKPDSQEICFVPDDDRTSLFADLAAKGAPATEPGEIVNEQGEILGRHTGLIHYTVGQRRGLGIAAPFPLYVLALDLPRRRLVVGYREDLARKHLSGDDFIAAVADFPAQWSSGQDLLGMSAPEVILKIRHRHVGARVASWELEGDELRVALEEQVHAAAPGQGMVLYARDIVLGGARILGAGI